MAGFAYFRVEHSSYNRDEWGYGRVGAAANYAANQNKRGHVATVGLPIFRTAYDAQRAFVQLEKLHTRKNARLGDSLIISFPKEVSEPHRIIMMERFLNRLTFGGRTFAQAWEHTDKPDNPHFHVVLVDRDRLTGKSIGKFGHSRSYRRKIGLEPNVTEWMRMQWEETGNSVFSDFGYDLMFDRRSNLERGLEPPQKHRGYQNDNQLIEDREVIKPDHSGDITEMINEDLHENAPDPSPEDEVEPYEDDMEPEFERVHESEISTAADRIRKVFANTIELNRIRNAKARITELDQRIEFLRRETSKIEKDRANHLVEATNLAQQHQAALNHYSSLRKDNGSLKGFSFGLFGLSFKSPTRLRAEAALIEVSRTENESQMASRIQSDYKRRIEQLNNDVAATEETALMMRNDVLGVNGSIDDLDRAESHHADEVNELVRGNDKTPPIDPYEAGRAWEEGEITDDELRTYCLQSGNAELLAELEEALEEERSLVL